jgi:glycerol-3-phosphate dehydrogenase (NAD(P)+)
MSALQTITVLGGGAWGTALALTAARAGREVTLLVRSPEAAAEINAAHGNEKRLKGVLFDKPLVATDDPAAAGVDLIIAAVPAQAMRAALAAIAPFVRPGTPVISSAKGLEKGSMERMSEVIREGVPRCRPAVLSGPSFAADVARGLPTAVTIAADDLALAEALAQALASSSFRPYASDDMAGVEIGGALKNVLAIAAGIVVGKGLGASAQAALIARGFAELTRLATKLGARPETLMGLSGLGDLVLSASSHLSRNFSLGLSIGRGESQFEGGLAEGAHTASVAVALAHAHDVDVPIAAAVADVLSGAATIDEAIARLMSRPLKSE